MAARRRAVLGGHLSGIGGLDLGFKWAGIEIVWAKCVSADGPLFSAIDRANPPLLRLQVLRLPK